VPSIEERVAYLEGTVGEHTRAFSDQQHSVADVRTGLTELRTDMNRALADLRADMNQALAELRTDTNQALAELRTEMNLRFAQVDQRFLQIDARFDQLDHRFMWMFGTQLAVLLAVIAALAGAYYR